MVGVVRSGLWGRIKELFIGSDVYVPYTAVYTWASNQMAHAMMGFALAAGASRLIESVIPPNPGQTISSALWFEHGTLVIYGLVLILPPVKDLGDYLEGMKSAFGKFKPNSRELAYDGIADVSFWWLGMWLAIGLFKWQWWIGLVLAAIIVVNAIAVWRYIPEKRALDRARLPFYFRLPKFDVEITDVDRDRIVSFVNRVSTSGAPRHLIICGGYRSGKTPLGVGVGCELTVAQRRVRYVTGFEVEQEIVQVKQASVQAAQRVATASAPTEPWPLVAAEVAVIDDISLDDTTPHRIADINAHLGGVAHVVWLMTTRQDRAGAKNKADSVFDEADSWQIVYLPHPAPEPRPAGLVQKLIAGFRRGR